MFRIFSIFLLLQAATVSAQFFTMRHPYTGSHYAFSSFDATGLNQFVVQFNAMWQSDISTGFHQYEGNELGQTFSTSGMRFVWGKKDMQWTASTDYAIGFGKDKNEVTFNNGITQIFNLRATNNQINNTFGIALKENKFWLEAMYCTNLGRVFIEYATIHHNGVESYGSEYKLNGLYKGTIRTMEFGTQTSYRRKRVVMYARVLYPLAIVGPGKSERFFVDAQSTQPDPKDFPSNYNTYVNDPMGHIERSEGLQTTGFKGLSYGFGMLIIMGKIDE